MKRLEKQSERNDRLTAMGEMAARIAHEIRNPLGSIELFASILQREIEDENQKRLVSHICSGVKNLNHVISNLLAFTRQPKPVLEKIDLHKFLDELLLFGEFLTDKNDIRLKKEYYTSSLSVYGDEELLKQVFLNIIRNAVQAMQDGGVLKVKTGTGKKKRGSLGYIEVKISDTGIGISKDNLKNIFNPFFTTKDKGTGLGLAIVHNMIESHNGMIEVESREGKGTAFTILLPQRPFHRTKKK